MEINKLIIGDNLEILKLMDSESYLLFYRNIIFDLS